VYKKFSVHYLTVGDKISKARQAQLNGRAAQENDDENLAKAARL
jgi:hypothetical protein